MYRQGILAGLLGIGLSLAFYFFDRQSFMGSYAHTLSWVAVVAAFMFWSGLQIEPLIAYTDDASVLDSLPKFATPTMDYNPLTMFKFVFMVFAIACVMNHLFEFVLYNFINHSIAMEQQNMMMEAYKKLAQLEKHKSIEDNFVGVNFHDVPTTLWSIGKGLIGGGVISFILTVVLRRVR
ncbi:MAG: hypothetical protein RL757_2486 [Bacteroidota bacterium]